MDASRHRGRMQHDFYELYSFNKSGLGKPQKVFF